MEAYDRDHRQGQRLDEGRDSIHRIQLGDGRLREAQPAFPTAPPSYIPLRREEPRTAPALPRRAAPPRALPVRRGPAPWRRAEGGRMGYYGQESPAQAPRQPLGWQSRLAIQAAICVAILGIVWGLRTLEAPVAQTMVQGVRDAVTFEVNLDESIGRLRLVQQYLPNISAVFNPQTSLVAPVEGEASAFEREGVYQAADFSVQPGTPVMAAGAGEVLDAGQTEGGIGYLRLRHADGSEGRYENVEAITVTPGERVEKGSRLGVVADNGKVMRFTWIVGGKPADPGFLP